MRKTFHIIFGFLFLFSLQTPSALSQTNTTYGTSAGQAITTGSENSLFGYSAGSDLTTGKDNSFFGYIAGSQTTTGNDNTFFGSSAGWANLSGYGNSYFGSHSGVLGVGGGENSFFGGNTGPGSYGSYNVFFGTHAGYENSSGEKNVYVGSRAGWQSAHGTRNTFIGNYSGGDRDYSGSFNTLLGASTGAASEDFTYATAIGAYAVAASSNSITLGRPAGEDMVRIPGNLVLKTLSVGGFTPLCRNAYLLIATCSSSARYKSNITSFTPGLNLIRRLRPVSFKWKDSEVLDLGLVAEEVNKVEPLLVTHNKDGEIEGVKYDRVGVLAINAIKEQQSKIEHLEAENDLLRKDIGALRKRLKGHDDGLRKLKHMLCDLQPEASICEVEKK